MSNGLAIAGVTYALQYSLVNLYNNAGLPFGTVNVTCLAPDQVQSGLGSLTGPENQVNLFLHQVTHNAAWRNVDLPSLDGDGQTRLQSPPLALNLHYLLTVYGSEYWQAEALLGYALMMLHENPVLVRADIANALTALTKSPEPYPSNPLTNVLGGCGLADQVEMLKVTPETLGREEMAWLWTALKADYRPTFPFQVTVVLMQPQLPTSVAFPALIPNVTVTPIQPAAVLDIQPPRPQIVAQSTDIVTVIGEFLNGATQVVLSNSRYEIVDTILLTGVTPTSFTFVPNAGFANPAGMYSLTVQFLDSSSTPTQSVGPMAFPLAPTLLDQVATVVSNAEGRLVTVTMSPDVREGQDVSLSLASFSAPAQPFTGNVGSLSFQFPATLPSGPVLGRLQVDGVQNQVQFDLTKTPPFTGPMITI